jgi:hypothetical protein
MGSVEDTSQAIFVAEQQIDRSRVASATERGRKKTRRCNNFGGMIDTVEIRLE